LGLIQKNVYGAYIVREKASVTGHLWVGRNLVPRLMFYSLFFFGLLSVEIAVLVIQFFFQGRSPSLAVFYLVPITSVSAGLFLAEGFILWRRNKPDNSIKNDSVDEPT
jgi:ABC-type transport system involved in cytochrome c biogenesis permease subunit